uniref:Uncharacterized protein n=1 Tax=Plectus sambesii TaxID=2011161 RepID=A0A914VTB6_9BILA
MRLTHEVETVSTMRRGRRVERDQPGALPSQEAPSRVLAPRTVPIFAFATWVMEMAFVTAALDRQQLTAEGATAAPPAPSSSLTEHPSETLDDSAGGPSPFGALLFVRLTINASGVDDRLPPVVSSVDRSSGQTCRPIWGMTDWPRVWSGRRKTPIPEEPAERSLHCFALVRTVVYYLY